MLFLALAQTVNGAADFGNAEDVLRDEALHVKTLMDSGVITEIYFDEENSAVIKMTAESKAEAEEILNHLPLVKHGLIAFGVWALLPYTGFDRI